jgi:hypothetical protein
MYDCHCIIRQGIDCDLTCALLLLLLLLQVAVPIAMRFSTASSSAVQIAWDSQHGMLDSRAHIHQERGRSIS